LCKAGTCHRERRKSKNKPVLTEEGKQIFDKFLKATPAIMQKEREEKTLDILSLLMSANGITEAGKELVIKAAKYVVDKGYDPLFLMWEEMDTYKKVVLDTYDSREADKARSVKVKRWGRPTVEKPARPPGQMKVVAFCASPRKGGNTDLLVDEALKGAMSTGAQGEKIMLQNIKMGFCTGCRKCKEPDYEGMCMVKDDMTEIYQKIIDSDAIIIGFPIYTGRECAQLSTFLDRWDCFERFKFQPRLKPGRRAMVIGTWGYPYDDTYDFVMQNIIVILKLHGIETVEGLSACGFEGMFHGLDENKKGVIARHPEELKKAFQAGTVLVT
jgi:multimeric flavodoxin WrbA